MIKVSNVCFSFLILWVFITPLQGAFADEAEQAKLEQILAPIALYPDSLLSQVLMAATYPDQVAEAAEWSTQNPSMEGDAAVKAVQDKNWDPSVASLVAFPMALSMMGEKPDWVYELGDTFLANPDGVMDTIQTLRRKAQDQGNLESNEQQTVTVQEAPVPASQNSTQQNVVVDQAPAAQQQIIIIEPTNPEVIYVPAYNPTVVYGPWWYPNYPPPFYYPPPPRYGFYGGLATGIGFAAGIAIGDALWGDCNWGHNDIDIDVNRYNNINANNRLEVNQTDVSWKNEVRQDRRNVSVDQTQRNEIQNRVSSSDKREAFRGRTADRDAALASLQNRGIDPAKERSQLTGTGGDQVRDRVSQIDQSNQLQRTQDLSGARERAAAQSGFSNQDRAAAQQRLQDRSGRNLQNSYGDRGNAAAENLRNRSAQSRDFDRANASQVQNRIQQRPSAQPQHSSAFNGLGDGGASTRMQAQRGSMSRQSSASGLSRGGSGGGRSVGGGGGGGGGFRGGGRR
jgi:hypothetical protein